MGGTGSGTKAGGRKLTVEKCLQLDLAETGLRNILSELDASGKTSGGIVWLSGRTGVAISDLGFELERCHNEAVLTLKYGFCMQTSLLDMEYQVSLQSTVPTYGGLRWWLTCPGSDCDKRVAKLYLAPGETIFMCRHCNNLTYQSSQESHCLPPEVYLARLKAFTENCMNKISRQ